MLLFIFSLRYRFLLPISLLFGSISKFLMESDVAIMPEKIERKENWSTQMTWSLSYVNLELCMWHGKALPLLPARLKVWADAFLPYKFSSLSGSLGLWCGEKSHFNLRATRTNLLHLIAEILLPYPLLSYLGNIDRCCLRKHWGGKPFD